MGSLSSSQGLLLQYVIIFPLVTSLRIFRSSTPFLVSGKTRLTLFMFYIYRDCV